jgi:drug/metabolite transporter (DMT)-like permease
MQNDPVMPSFNILIAIFLWSSLGVIVRQAGVSVHVLIFYSCLVSLLVQGAVLSLKGFRKEIPNIRTLKFPAILGVFGLLNTFSYYFAFKTTTIANAVLTHYTAPVIVAFLAPVFLKESVGKRVIAAIVIASAGLWLMLNGFSLNDSNAAGLMAGLISGIAYAIIVILARVFTQDTHPLVLTFVQNAVIAAMLLPFIREVPMHAFWILLVMGVVHSTIAPVLYYRGIKYVTANRAAVLGYLEPVSAIIFSMFFLGEMPGKGSIMGGILILFSGYLTLMEERPDAKKA